MRHHVQELLPNNSPHCGGGNAPGAWLFQNNYEPEFGSRHERRVGRLGDGGKWICDPHRLRPTTTKVESSLQEQPQPCLVYSVGFFI